MPKTGRTCTCTKPTISARSARRGARRLASTVALLATIAAQSAARPAAAAPALAAPISADARLDAVAEQYFATEWQLDPVRASLAGHHDGDDRLGDFTETGFARRIAFARRTLRELVTIDFGDLSPEHDDDAEMLRSHLELQLMAIDERRVWRHDPSLYLRIAATGAQSLLDRDYAPAPLRVRALVARERAIPAMLESALRQIDDVDPATAEVARATLGGTVAYFSGPVADVASGLGNPQLAGDLAASNAAVVAALRTFAAGLETGPFARPAGTFAIGPDRFTRMIALTEESQALTTAELERTAVGSLERTRGDFAATARKIDPAHPPQAVALALGALHPPPAKLLETAESDIAQLRRFVDDKKLITLPAEGDVRVVETPAYARGGAVASLSAAGPLEKNATVAYYDVTIPGDNVSPARRAAELALLNDFTFPLISAHEVMPGHYVNAELDRHERLSLVRRLLPSRSFTEGWAHYDEQMLVDQGWGNGDPRVRLAQLQLSLQRECRFIVALRMHTEGMSVADATRFFVENAYFGEETARGEALRASQDPMDGAYFLGKIEILKLRDDYRAKLGKSFTIQGFHDALLARGDPPVAIARKELLGADDDGRLLY